MMNFVLNTRNFVSKTRNLVSKTRNLVLKMMNSAGMCGSKPGKALPGETVKIKAGSVAICI